MVTGTKTEFNSKLDELYASTPKLPLDDPDAPLVQSPEKGDVRVKGSRVHLYLILEDYLEDGATLEDLDERYSTLTIEEFTNIIDYYERNKEIVDEYLAHTKVIGDLVEAHMREKYPQEGLLGRLKARLENGSAQL